MIAEARDGRQYPGHLSANATTVVTSYAYPLYLAATRDGAYSDFVYFDVTPIAGVSALRSQKIATSRAPAQTR